MTCKNCIHYDICNEQADGNIVELMKEPCFRFMELVRCKDCKCVSDAVKDEYGNAHLLCTMLMGLPVDPTDYCSYGERIADE